MVWCEDNTCTAAAHNRPVERGSRVRYVLYEGESYLILSINTGININS